LLRSRDALLVVTISLCLCVSAFGQLQTSFDSLVQAERSFARTSISQGVKEAFLSVLADDSVIFRPHAVSGKKWMKENPAPNSQLSWEPEFADIAKAGDLGYTTGPWEVRRTPQDPPAAFGHYVTMWRKQSGKWKVELDNGIGHERAKKPTKVDSPQIPKTMIGTSSKAETDKARAWIASADRIAASALAEYFAEDVRLYRDGSLPYLGRFDALKKLSEIPGTLTCTQTDVKLSDSADLGYTYGTAEFKPKDATKAPEYSNYLRIWKRQRDNSWKIVLDLLSAAPKP
jgi:ketosteroid isomerase-like protein